MTKVTEVKEVSAKELAKIAREDLKMRIADGLVTKDGEIVVDLSSGELLVRGENHDIVVKVIVKTKRLDIEVEDDDQGEDEQEVVEEA